MRHFKQIASGESVGIGHPDKVCDIVADTILDYCLIEDPLSRVAVEVMISGTTLIISGEITSQASPLLRIKASKESLLLCGYNPDAFTVIDIIRTQSPELNLLSTAGFAGDQCLVVGYACEGGIRGIPEAHGLAHDVMRSLNTLRTENVGPLKGVLGSDAKCLIVSRNDGTYKAHVSISHKRQLTDEHVNELNSHVLQNNLITAVEINPGGSFMVSGPEADAGVTGRKIVVDAYGPYVSVGGGAFSGKDPSKLDRSGAYMMRYLARQVVREYGGECRIIATYMIGKSLPVDLQVHHSSVNKGLENGLRIGILKNYDLSTEGIINFLNLRNPIYQKTSYFGHFGRLPERKGEFSWEV